MISFNWEREHVVFVCAGDNSTLVGGMAWYWQNVHACKMRYRIICYYMGKVKILIDELIEKRSKGVEFLKLSTSMKLLMKGIDVKKITDETPDDNDVIERIYKVASELNIVLTGK